MSGYIYVANNPIILNDPTGKDWTITREQDKDGNIVITMTFSLAFYNKSEGKINMDKFLSSIIKQIENTYSSSEKNLEGTGTFKHVTNVNARVLDDTKNRKNSEHLLRIIRADEVKGDYGHANKIGGKEVVINAKHVQHIIDGEDNNTIPHEFGHTLGLLHPDDLATLGEGLIPWNPINQYLSTRTINQNPNNVMYSGGSGLINDKTSTMVTRDQINAIYQKYMTKSLNKKE